MLFEIFYVVVEVTGVVFVFLLRSKTRRSWELVVGYRELLPSKV